MTEPVYRNVSTCVHGVKNFMTHVQDGTEFWIPGCYTGTEAKRIMRGHVADDRYPVEPLPAVPRRPRSDRGVKRGPRK